jgi:hypothetical protein
MLKRSEIVRVCIAWASRVVVFADMIYVTARINRDASGWWHVFDVELLPPFN